jgi:hypothetical protein
MNKFVWVEKRHPSGGKRHLMIEFLKKIVCI